MGIPGFNTWFSEKYGKAYVPLGKVRVDHLYIDLNSVLHTVMRKARNHNHFHKLLHKRLHAILDATNPTKSVMLAVDGPAPLAKLLTQRERRKKTGRTVDEGETLTGVAITPGTTFMLDLSHSLAYYCCTKMAGRRFRHLLFELSDGTVMGEGEVKVLGRLARPWFQDEPGDTHVILGDDADLILMALTSYKENLYVANSGLNDGRLDARLPVFSVNLLHQQWAAGALRGLLAAGQPLQSALLNAKLDLTLIAILAKGNDYLPAVRGASLEGSGRAGLWPAYQHALSRYGAAGSAPAAAPLLAATGSVTSLDPDSREPRIDAAALAALLQASGAGSHSGGRDGGGEWLGSRQAADPWAYLRGCVWLLQMYLTGQCPDYRFYYDGVAPTAAVLRSTLEAAVRQGRPFLSLADFDARTPPDPRAPRPLLPVACALALLPANCAHLAAPCVRHLMAASPPASDDEGEEAEAAPSAFDQELYFHLYGECGECRHMSAESARLQRAMQTARAARNTLSNRLDAVRAGTAPVGDADAEQQLRAELDAADDEAEKLKGQISALESKRKRHIESAHPYRRFPVEKLEAVAEAALEAAEVQEAERPATSFGRPFVIRAFNNKPEAASFIRTVSSNLSSHRHSHHHHGHHGHTHGQPNGQRGYATGAAAAAGSEYDLIYQPPPPPFAVEGPCYFAPALVRQEVLYDEYGSGQPLELRFAPAAGVPEYLSQPDGAARVAEQKQHGAQKPAANRQPHQPSTAGAQYQLQQPRPQQTPAPPPAPVQLLQRQAQPAAGGRPLAAAPAGGGGGGPALAPPPVPRLAQAVAAVEAARAAAATATAAGASARQASAAAAESSEAAAGAAAAPKRRGRKPKAVTAATGGSGEAPSTSSPASPTGGDAVMEGPSDSGGEGAGPSVGAEGGAARSKRGRPRKAKAKAGADSAGGEAPTAPTPMSASAAALALPPPPGLALPMPSSRLLGNALAAARAPAAAGAAPPPMPLPPSAFGGGAPHPPAPYQPHMQGWAPQPQLQAQWHASYYPQQPYGGAYGAAPPAYMPPPGVSGTGAPPPQPMRLLPAGVRPPPLAVVPTAAAQAAAAAATAAAQGRVRPAGSPGRRWP
ncbi:hypothetical protein HYH03_010208 [Edaphochlamys debaryana]|uniref:Xrn1 N-terminal domain-containing protein n=1 Tax=Edaphochlamys debaryana TaxID=47281 RepID=A0A835Y5H1_9CHLO|nr:hypothetical protein HYH03_010208 [Edaphochlamys debaryana]|eukprot:KAG2491419.1 hypothetical protein HYH03_010208 [Edaphochlamys debaryana]